MLTNMKPVEMEIVVSGDKENCMEELLKPEISMETLVSTQETASKSLRKSVRAKKTPIHLVENSMVVSQKFKPKGVVNTSRGIPKPKLIRQQQQQQQHLYSDFKCDHCGSRYVVNPMRRGNKISTSKYKAAPRHKIDPETQKILTLCNACGLKFGRAKKSRLHKVELSEEDQKKFIEEGETFGKELASKLENEAASQLFCSHAKKLACGCIQKFIIGDCTDTPGAYEEIMGRAQLLLEILERATELKKMKCYDPNTLESKPGKRNTPKIGLGNGHRKSKEFEEYVLSKRVYLRNDLKLCEKAAQKILSYSNNFLHKRMKTDPEKGIRVERQKGKAALGMLKPIDDLPLDPCCADNCVRMALTHGRLLDCWRERAISGQVEARRVLAEMLTPSGGNRANCYKFISWVTGCSNTTIGKVNEQMKSTGGDREPPEHGLKKYWRFNPKAKKCNDIMEPIFVPSYQILQTAASSAGLATMMQNVVSVPETPQKKKSKKQKSQKNANEAKGEKVDFTATRQSRLPNTIKIVDNAEAAAIAAAANNLSAYPSAVIAVNGQFPNNGFISIPAGLTSESTVQIPNTISTISLQAFQQQLQQQQQQQQLQLQIQLLQQQLQNSQNATLAAQAAQTIRHTTEGATTEYIVTPTAIEQSVGTPVVVTVATPGHASVMQNVVTQTLLPNVVNTETVLPTIVAQSHSNMDYLTPTANMNILQALGNQTKVTPNISLMTSPLRNSNEISIITQNNPVSINVLNTANNITEASILTEQRVAQPVAQQVHLIAATQASPTMAMSQPVNISLQQPPISLSSLPTMLLTSTSQDHLVQQHHHHHHQLILQQATAAAYQQQQHQRPVEQQQQQQQQQQVVLQRAHTNTLSSGGATSQLIVHHQPMNNQPTCEHGAVITSSLLPPIMSFNADAFLTSGTNTVGTPYTVVNTAALSDIQS